MRTDEQRASRRLIGLLALSAVLHGALAWLSPAQRTSPQAPAMPLVASLRLHPAATTELLPPRPSRTVAAQPEARRPEKQVNSPMLRPAPVAAAPAIAMAPSRPEPLPAAAAGAAPASSAMPAIAAEVAASAPPAVAVVQPSVGRERPDMLADYRRQLAELFAGRRDYPRLAAMRGWEGEVRLRLRVARKGSLLAVQLEHSSGFEVLDRYAQSMVEDLGRLPAMPEALAQEELQIVVPINFKLRKTI